MGGADNEEETEIVSLLQQAFEVIHCNDDNDNGYCDGRAWYSKNSC